jgi:autophagy-related protein 9
MNYNLISNKEIDLLLSRLYKYYVGKGFTQIILSQILNILTLGVVMFAFLFLTSCINYEKLKLITDINTYQFYEILYFKVHWFIILSLSFFSLFWIWKMISLISDIKTLTNIRNFYKDKLDISDNELPLYRWSQIVEKLKNVDYFIDKEIELDALNVAIRIMKKENYITGLYNNDILKLNAPEMIGGKPFINKLLEWDLSFCIVDYIFDSSGNLKENIINSDNEYTVKLSEELSKRFRIMGLLNIICFPFILIYMSIQYVFKYGEKFYTQPSLLSARQWSLIAQWEFREYNELPHNFEERINIGGKHAQKYLDQFPNYLYDAFAKFIQLVSGCFLIILLLLSLINEHVLTNLNILGSKNTIWVIGIFCTILALSRNLLVSEYKKNPEKAMKNITKYIHDIPSKWLENSKDSTVLKEFKELYEFRLMTLIKELLGILIIPYMLIVIIPKSSLDIIKFIKMNSVQVDNIGYVYNLSLFDTKIQSQSQLQLQTKYGSTSLQVSTSIPVQVVRSYKMEKSYVSFRMNNPEWESNKSNNNLINWLKTSENLLDDSLLYDALNSYSENTNIDENITMLYNV